jgi:Glycosyl transferase family 2
MMADERKASIALHREEQQKCMKALAVRRGLALLRKSRPIQFPVPWHLVIPCYNYGRYLQEGVDSVLLNDADYVVTIVDDASMDDTSEVGQRFAHTYPHVSYVRHAEHVGASHARNKGSPLWIVYSWCSSMPTIGSVRIICSRQRSF